MKRQDIDSFFAALAAAHQTPLAIYLTGGIASWFLGGNRPTTDIDFAVSESSEELERHLEQTSLALEIPIQYSDDIQRWGMINVPEIYEDASQYKKFGSVTVFILAPEKWAIGKLNRYLESDLEDLVVVFRKQKPNLKKTLDYWKRALRESPASTQQALFKRQVNHFLKNYGKSIWGKACPETLFDLTPSKHR